MLGWDGEQDCRAGEVEGNNLIYHGMAKVRIVVRSVGHVSKGRAIWLCGYLGDSGRLWETLGLVKTGTT